MTAPSTRIPVQEDKKMNLKDLKVGDVLWLQPDKYGRSNPQGHEITVTKIGKKWVSFGSGWRSGRFDSTTGYVDGKGYASPGRVYASEQAWRDWEEVSSAWQSFRGSVSRYFVAPANMTLERIAQARALLDLDGEESQ